MHIRRGKSRSWWRRTKRVKRMFGFGIGFKKGIVKVEENAKGAKNKDWPKVPFKCELGALKNILLWIKGIIEYLDGKVVIFCQLTFAAWNPPW